MNKVRSLNYLVGTHIFHDINHDSAKFYYKKIKPKMKFGMPQPGENDSIRLRHLYPPVKSLKIIQQDICSKLQQIELPACMLGSVKGSNSIVTALCHIESKYFFKLDMKEYFSKISNARVHHTLTELGFPWKTARAITRLCTNNYSLPQGASSSPVLANLVFLETAKQLQAFADKHHLILTVYLDDIIFSSYYNFKRFTSGIIDIIKSNDFSLNHKKISYRHDMCEVTGLFVGNSKLKIHPAMINAAQINRNVSGYVTYVKKCYKEYQISKHRSLNM